MKNDHKKEFPKDLYLVRVFNNKLVELLEVFCTSYFAIRNQELNHYYTKLVIIIDSFLELPYPEFEELASQKPQLPESLIGDIDDIDILWEHKLSPAVHKFNGKIEQCFLQAGSKSFPIDKDTKGFLKHIDKAIEKLKKINEDEMEKLAFGEKVLVCGNLRLDLQKTTLRYRNLKPIEISPDTNEIKLLSLLMRGKRLVGYKKIAKTLDLNCYHLDYPDKQHARDIQFIRRDLNPILERAGMTREEINKMIIAKKNTGYKLHCVS
jgi:hypothetical protein